MSRAYLFSTIQFKENLSVRKMTWFAGILIASSRVSIYWTVCTIEIILETIYKKRGETKRFHKNIKSNISFQHLRIFSLSRPSLLITAVAEDFVSLSGRQNRGGSTLNFSAACSMLPYLAHGTKAPRRFIPLNCF